MKKYLSIFYSHCSPYDTKISFLRENWDWRSRFIYFQNRLKTSILTGKNVFRTAVTCKRCIYHSNIPNIYINRNGLCNMCVEYLNNYSEEHLKKELETVIDTSNDKGEYHACVAFSGGRDSTVALYLAKKKYGMKVCAVMVDNGFIPKDVTDDCYRIASSLNVPFSIIKYDGFKDTLKDLYLSSFNKGYPCHVCSQEFKRLIFQFCKERNISKIILGKNFWGMISPIVSSFKEWKDPKTGFKANFISFPFLMGIKEKDLPEILSNVDWRFKGIYGNSTNCNIPGLVEKTACRRIGFHPETILLGGEVISGFLSREHALRAISEVRDNEELLKKQIGIEADHAY